MAFSTQRAFLNVPYRNEEPPLPDGKRSDCQLKSYESCTDVRAWSLDPAITSKFLIDVARKSRFQRKLPRVRSGFVIGPLKSLINNEPFSLVVTIS